jgi:two-component sensor histidine kinase
MGFYNYIFLLNSDWKSWMTLFFNVSIAILSLFLWFFLSEKEPVYTIPEKVSSLVSLFNIVAAAFVMFIIMIYFSRIINSKDEALIKANLVLEKKNNEIVGQHKELEILLKEVQHRVKNNMQIISSLISLEYGNIENEEAIKALSETRRRIEAIAVIH